MARTVLVVSDAFYPDPRVGAVRVSQFCRNLAGGSHWRPVVVARDRGFRPAAQTKTEDDYSGVDVTWLGGATGRSEALPAVENTLRTSAQRPSDRWSRRVLQAIVRPDPSVAFWLRQIGCLAHQARQHDAQVVFSTSPPHAVHLAAMLAARRARIPWVCDFRDPYVLEQHRRGQPRRVIARRVDRGLEALMIRRAAAVVHAIPLHHRHMRRSYPAHARNMYCIPNGVPDHLLDRPCRPPSVDAQDPVVIAIVGYLPEHEAELLHAAATRLQRSVGRVIVRAVGRPPHNASELVRAGGAVFEARGRVPHDQALAAMAASDVLVCALEPQRRQSVRLSSKLFEYFAIGVPVLVINPTRCDHWLLRKMPGSAVVHTPSVAELARHLQQALSAEARARACRNPAAVAPFSRSAQAKALAGIFDTVAADAPGGMR